MFETIIKEKKVGNMTIAYPKKVLSSKWNLLAETIVVATMFITFIIYEFVF
jgi:hypothetical protein